MLLAADIGNTQIKLGLFEGEALRATWRIATDSARLADEYAMLIANLFAFDGWDRRQVDGGVYASVVPSLSPVFDEVFRRHLGIKALRVGAGVKTGMRILYEPRELGPDRIAEALGARHLHPPPLIIVHLGTATVFEAVSREGDFMGGAIAPGIGMAAESLPSRTAMLPSVDLRPPKGVIGTNTVAAMQAGILYGFADMIEGMVGRLKAEVGADAWVVGTGGWAYLMSDLVKSFDHVDDYLGLHGLRLLYELNEAS